MGQLQSIRHPDSERRFAYDVLGRVIQMSDGQSTQTRQYDNIGRLAGVSDQSALGAARITYAYDDLDRLMRIPGHRDRVFRAIQHSADFATITLFEKYEVLFVSGQLFHVYSFLAIPRR